MEAAVDSLQTSTEVPADRALNLTAIVDGLARELHPQHGRRGNATLSSRLERDLGIDSLGRTELVMRLERAFGIRLPINLVTEAETIGDLLRAVEQADQSGTRIAAAPPPVVPSPSVIAGPT